MRKKKFVSFLLRFGLGITFLYAGISSFINPSEWVGFFPSFLRDIVSDGALLITFSVIEILLSLWLFSGRMQQYAAVSSALLLVGILVFNIGAFDIVFRDGGLIFSAAALFFSHEKHI